MRAFGRGELNMKLHRSWAIKRGCAVIFASALAATPVLAVPAFAENTQAVAAAAQTAAQENAAGQAVEATTQTDLDNAAEGSTVELKGTITTELSINKKLTVTAASDAVMKSTLNINANDVTVSGVHFALDGTTRASISLRDNGKTGLTVKGCAFDITNGADSLNSQLNSVWLGYDANSATFDGNTFNINLPGVDQSYVGINIVGASVKNTTVSNNQVYFRKDAMPVASAHFIIANGNKQAEGDYGLSGLKVTNNKGGNMTGIAASKSNTYGIGVSNVEDAVISGNTFNGLFIAIKPSMWPNEAPSKSIQVAKNTFSNCYVGIAMRTTDVQPGAVVSTGNDLGTTTIPYASLNGGDCALVWQSDNGALYPTVSDAVSSGKTSLALVRNIKNLSGDDSVGTGQNVSIDLNGHSISGTLANNGTLTIKDSAGLEGLKSSVLFKGDGKTVIEGGTYNDDAALKHLADDRGILVRTDADSQTFTVLPKKDILADGKGKVITEKGDLFFSTLEEAKDYAEKNGISGDNVMQAAYTVKFDTHGNGEVDSIVVEAGKPIRLPAVPTVSGYKDGAWYDGDKKVENEFTPTSDTTLVAKWVKITGTDGNDRPGDNGSSVSDDSKDGTARNRASKTSGKPLPQTGDGSSATAFAAAATGMIAAGMGIAMHKRQHDA